MPLLTPCTVHRSKLPTDVVALMLQELLMAAKLHSRMSEQIMPALLPELPLLKRMLWRS